MAEAGETAEIAVLRENLDYIINTATRVGDLHWFANKLCEYGLISLEKKRIVMNETGSSYQKATDLMESVFAKVEQKSKHFQRFLDIFRNDKAYDDLIEKLLKDLSGNYV